METFFYILTIFIATTRISTMPITLIWTKGLGAVGITNQIASYLVCFIIAGFIWVTVIDSIWFFVVDKPIPILALLASFVLGAISSFFQRSTFEPQTKILMISELIFILAFALWGISSGDRSWL